MKNTSKRRSTRKIIEQNQNKQIRVESLEITGDLGAGVIIQSSHADLTMINIAGGAISGDAYQIISRGEQPDSPEIEDFEEIDEAIKELDTNQENREHLNDAVKELRAQIAQGPQCDIAMINYLLNWISDISPELLTTISDWILNSDEASEEAKVLAQQALRSSKK